MHSAEPTARAVLRVVSIAVLSAITLYLVYLLRTPLGWLFLAGFIAVAVSAPVNRLARVMPRGIAITVVYLLLLGLPLALIALVVPTLVTQGIDLAQDLPEYADDVQVFLQDNDRLRELDERYDLGAQLQDQADQIPEALGSAAGILSDLGLGLVNSIFALVNILILSIFMVASGSRWTTAALATRPAGERVRIQRVLTRVVDAVAGYVQGAIAVAMIAGTSTFIVLSILGVPFALPLAVVAGLFSLIPLIGATIAAVIIAIVTLFEDFPSSTIIWVVWAIVYQQLENNLVQPQIQKRTVQVQPIVVLVAVLFGSTLLGIVGALLAIPVAASIQIALNEWLDYRRTGTAPITVEVAEGETFVSGQQIAGDPSDADHPGPAVSPDDGSDLPDR